MPTDRVAIREDQAVLKLFSGEGFEGDFIPWGCGEHGQQTWLKLKREEQVGYLYAGVGGVLEAEVQKSLMRLLNDGWSVEGEVSVSFDGTSEPGLEDLGPPEACLLEIGTGLLPLVDPFQKAPLLERFRELRRELARETGIVTPGVKVQDNLSLPPSGYQVRLRGVLVATGEIFLDRFLAVGTLEQLGRLTGWSTVDPSYRVPAKWIEPSEREAAEAAGCMLLGGLAVLLTHLREIIRTHAAETLGLQETYNLLSRLKQTHPIVVEEFLGSIDRVRKVRRILHSLLAEGVSVRDLVTILETLGEHLGRLEASEEITEVVREALGRQILTSYMDAEGGVRAMVLADDVEKWLLDPSGRDPEDFVRVVKEAHEEHHYPPILFTDPRVRRDVRKRLRESMPGLGVLSLREIPADFGGKLEVAGQVRFKKAEATSAPSEASPAADEGAGFWRTRKKKK